MPCRNVALPETAGAWRHLSVTLACNGYLTRRARSIGRHRLHRIAGEPRRPFRSQRAAIIRRSISCRNLCTNCRRRRVAQSRATPSRSAPRAPPMPECTNPMATKTPIAAALRQTPCDAHRLWRGICGSGGGSWGNGGGSWDKGGGSPMNSASSGTFPARSQPLNPTFQTCKLRGSEILERMAWLRPKR
jgi:hypothetical protein